MGRTTRRAYDAAGRLVSTVLPTGETIDATYDPVDRVLSRTAGGSVERFTYDVAGRRVHMEDATGTTRYRYDAAGRLGAVVGPDGATVAIGYDAAGQRVSLSYPGGRQVAYAYNSDGRLVSLNETPGGRGAAGPIVEGILPRTVSFRTGRTGEPRKSSGYVLAMRLIAATGPAGQRATFEVDADGRLLRETLSSGWTRAYEYQGGLLSSFAETTNGAPLTTRTTRLERDADGRIVAETTAGKTIRYRYDAAGQLVGVDGGPGGPRTFEYDATGNRTASVEGGVTSRYSYDAADQLLRATRGGTPPARTTPIPPSATGVSSRSATTSTCGPARTIRTPAVSPAPTPSTGCRARPSPPTRTTTQTTTR